MPFPNEHSARLVRPGKFDEFRRQNDRFGSGRHAIFGIIKGPPRRSELQAIRFDKDKHSPREARKWLRDHDEFKVILFEVATESGKRAAEDLAMMREGFDPDLTCRAFTIRQETADEKKRSVQAVIASESPVAVRDFRTGEPIDEVLMIAGLRTPDQVPLLDSHMRFGIGNVLGSTRGFHREKDKDKGRILTADNFFADTESGREAFQLVLEGHVRDFSIGYRVTAFADIEPRQSADIGGRKFTAGDRMLRVSLRAEVKENSLVSIGADPIARVR